MVYHLLVLRCHINDSSTTEGQIEPLESFYSWSPSRFLQTSTPSPLPAPCHLPRSRQTKVVCKAPSRIKNELI